MKTKLLALGLIIAFCGVTVAVEEPTVTRDDCWRLSTEPSEIRTVVGVDSCFTRKVVALNKNNEVSGALVYYPSSCSVHLPTLFNVTKCERPKVYARLFETARDDMIKEKNGCSYALDKLWSAMLKIERFATVKEVTRDSVTMNVTDGTTGELALKTSAVEEGLKRTIACRGIEFHKPELHSEEGKDCNTYIQISCDGNQRCRQKLSGVTYRNNPEANRENLCGKQLSALHEACMQYAKDNFDNYDK